MSAKLIALKLFLDELGVDSTIDTVDDRKRVQKAVYLGQVARVDLGYRFGWYIRGPYSPSLTKDYFALAGATNTGEIEIGDKALKPNLPARLARIRPMLVPPGNVTLSQEDWLELLASLHYLRCVSKFDRDKAAERIKTEKSHLKEYINEAESQLQTYDLMPMSNDSPLS